MSSILCAHSDNSMCVRCQHRSIPRLLAAVEMQSHCILTARCIWHRFSPLQCIQRGSGCCPWRPAFALAMRSHLHCNPCLEKKNRKDPPSQSNSPAAVCPAEQCRLQRWSEQADSAEWRTRFSAFAARISLSSAVSAESGLMFAECRIFTVR